MTSKKLGALLRSVPPATARAEVLPPLVSAPILPAKPPRPVERAATEPDVPLQVLIPKHIRKRLAVKAAEEGRSLRALMLTAIRSRGIEVSDAEIRGKRGRRNL
jgi:hypothetical protein